MSLPPWDLGTAIHAFFPAAFYYLLCQKVRACVMAACKLAIHSRPCRGFVFNVLFSWRINFLMAVSLTTLWFGLVDVVVVSASPLVDDARLDDARLVDDAPLPSSSLVAGEVRFAHSSSSSDSSSDSSSSTSSYKQIFGALAAGNDAHAPLQNASLSSAQTLCDRIPTCVGITHNVRVKSATFYLVSLQKKRVVAICSSPKGIS